MIAKLDAMLGEISKDLKFGQAPGRVHEPLRDTS
jgi:hypothetical protein